MLPLQWFQQPLRLTLKSASMILSSASSTVAPQAHYAASTTDDEPPRTGAVQPFSAIPGPKPLPVLRNLLKFRKNLFTLNQYLEECSEKYGDIFKLEAPGGNNFVYMANPSALENVLRVEGKYPRRETNLSPYMQWILNKQNFAIPLPFKSGEDWKKARSASNNQIKPSNVHSYTPGVNDIIGSFVNYVQSARDGDGRIGDITIPMKRLIASSTAKIVYNADLHVFDNPTKETEEFIAAIKLIFDCILKVLIEPPFFKLYHSKVYRDLKKGFTITTKYAMKYADEVHRMAEAGEERPVQGLLEQWLREGKMDQMEAIMASTSMFSAGVDSTASQAIFMLHCMAKNPEAQEKLYREIKSVLGDRTQPTTEDLTKMPYLKGCMMESFRTLPSGIIIARVLTNDVTMMGYSIPAETNIVYLNSVAAKNKDIFPNPEVFDPERWARDKPNPFALLLFGFGPRMCYGKRFAELELKLLLCQVIQKYRLRTDKEKLDVDFAAIVRPKGEVPIYFEDRH